MPAKSSFAPPENVRALVVASRFNEMVTRKLLDGALHALEHAGYGEDRVDVLWAAGAFELPVVIHKGLATGRYTLAVAVGAVIRGETPHFDYIAAEASRGLAQAAIEYHLPVGFGLLTCETMDQALARAGGDAGNKGTEAAQAAIETARVLRSFDGDATR